jgi:Protein of unknown function (DUF3575)
MKKNIIYLLFLITSNCFSQTNKKNQFSIGTNPLSLVEPHTGIGFCISDKFNEKIGVWGEFTYFFNNPYILNEWKNFKGYRLIIQPRYYINSSKNIFIAPELRIKGFSFDSKLNYLNKTTNDTLRNFITPESQKIIGGAIIVGKDINLGKYFFLELTAGFGARQRIISRKNLPIGYEYLEIEKVTKGPSFINLNHFEKNKGQSFYVPIGIRFMWKIN